MTEAEHVFPLRPLMQQSKPYYTWGRKAFFHSPTHPELGEPGNINIEVSWIPIDSDGIPDDTALSFEAWDTKVDRLLEECHLDPGI